MNPCQKLRLDKKAITIRGHVPDEQEVQKLVRALQDQKSKSERLQRAREHFATAIEPMAATNKFIAEFFQERIPRPRWENVDPTGAKREAWKQVYGRLPASPSVLSGASLGLGVRGLKPTKSTNLRSQQRTGGSAGANATVLTGRDGKVEKTPFAPDEAGGLQSAELKLEGSRDTRLGLRGPTPELLNRKTLANRAKEIGRTVKKPVRRNAKYELIDKALREISEAHPKNHAEVFRILDDREILLPNRKSFKTAGGWTRGFQRNPHEASAWLSTAWKRLGLAAFARGPK